MQHAGQTRPVRIVGRRHRAADSCRVGSRSCQAATVGLKGQKIGSVEAARRRAKQGLAWHSAKPHAAVVAGYEFKELAAIATEAGRLAILVALHAAHLPPAQNLVGNAAFVQESFAFTYWQFVEIAQDKGVRDVLVADALFIFEVVDILRQRSARELRERGQRAVRIRERLRIGVGSEEVEAVSEPAFHLHKQGVVAGLPRVFQTAVGVDHSVLGKWAKSLANGARESGERS